MATPKKSDNRHPVDRLSDLREQIKALKAEEEMLRAQIIDSGDFVGLEFVAMLKTTTRRLLDRTALELRFGKPAIDECCKDSDSTTLNLFKKAEMSPSTAMFTKRK